MFQTAELGQKVSKKEFKEQELVLRTNLLALQQELLKKGDYSVLIDFAGVRGAGKGTSANLLNKWMDARWIVTHAYDEPTDEEAGRPRFWKFWRYMPPRGQIGIHLSGRYSRPLLDHVYGEIDQSEFRHQLDRINNFEKALADDGTMVLKFWMHISKEAQKERLEKLEKDPLRSWRMSDIDWKHYEMYDRFIEAAELIMMHTNTGHAPWEIVEGEHRRYRALRVGELVQENLERHLVSEEIRQKYLTEMRARLDEKTEEQEAEGMNHAITILDQLDFAKTLEKSRYRKKLAHGQARLAALHGEMTHRKQSTILVFEGPDAAGKGGAIRQITEALDARYYKVYPFAAPTETERAHHYLWRRAFAEINDFEDQLIEDGIVLVKFWLQISKDEQLARFKSREVTPHKRWKLQDEDWRNREKWDDYNVAAHEMIQQTSVKKSPWVVVENESKHYGRIKVLNAVCDALEAALDK